VSYETENEFPLKARIDRLKQIITLLGFEEINISHNKNCIESYFWSSDKDYKSYVGVELSIYMIKDKIKITTRSRVGRSYWDLLKQNDTVTFLFDVFGGTFRSDAGEKKLETISEKPPAKLKTGLYLANWNYYNAMIKPELYLKERGVVQLDINKKNPFNMIFKEFNPYYFSNNLLIPYLVAAWEQLFKESFVVLLKCSDNKAAILKKGYLSNHQLEKISFGKTTIEDEFVNSFSFQKPANISENFNIIDKNLDLAGQLKKPFKNRKKTLYESIEETVLLRHKIVHTGKIDILIEEKKLKTIINDFKISTKRIYKYFGCKYNFVPKKIY